MSTITLLPSRPATTQHHHLDRRALALIEQANIGTDDELLSTARLAVWLAVSIAWLEIGRTRGYGPRYIRIGRRVRYRRADVAAWLEERAHCWSGEYADPARKQGRPVGSKLVNGKVIPPVEANQTTTVRRRAVLLPPEQRGCPVHGKEGGGPAA